MTAGSQSAGRLTTAARATRFAALDFAQAPFLVIWEVTRACDLACVHCRAEAVRFRHPMELSTDEGRRLLDQVRIFGQPLVVLTGGDPIKRPDVYDLVRYGDGLGLRMTMTPSGTPLMTPVVIERLQAAGLARLAVSLDGSHAAIHDAFRRVPGSFDWSVGTLRHARQIGLSTQVNTTITRHNIDDVDRLAAFLVTLEIDLWSVFFLVPTGRGKAEDDIDAEQHEAVFAKMEALAQRVRFDIKSTAAPAYRRFLLQQRTAARRQGRAARPPGVGFTLRGGAARAAQGVNDGNGLVFVSHVGDVYPSGFLPVSAGNVRQTPLPQLYRDSALFQGLRDYGALKGKCALCEFRAVCGGSRARAYAMFGDYLESDPSCIYVPGPYRRLVARGAAEPAAEYFARRRAAAVAALPPA